MTTRTWPATDLIGLSLRSGRIVTEYPANAAEFATLTDALRRRATEARDVSGEGRSGRERAGFVRFVGDGWTVDVLRVS